jgi:DNA polymerase III delta prime subunit
MQLGDLLVRGKLITVKQLKEALRIQGECGGRLGAILVEMGALEQQALDEFLTRMPVEPKDIAATGMDETELVGMLMKVIYSGRLESVRQFVEAIKLPYHVVLDLVKAAVDRQLLQALGTRESSSLAELCYSMTEQGRQWTLDALEQVRYAGPAPVTLEQFNERVNLQKITNEVISLGDIEKALEDLTFDRSILEQVGPALNSGRAILLYGPPGNGKTSVAMRFTSMFDDVVYVPYAVMVEGQIIRVFDPSLHVPLTSTEVDDDGNLSFVRNDVYDERWVPCRRPFVVAGGELTLEMLDLRYSETSHFYEAPLHVKALGGCFLIDDFGRQLVSPSALLNRWIVPLESRVDYLKLHTGKSFSIPFEELVIFSTNIDPEDLMDPAFLRRLPYKIEVGAPSMESYERIFTKECARQGLEISGEVFERIVYKVTQEKELELAAYHPRFIVDQVVATCRFMGEAPHFERRFIDYAVDNLRVRQGGEAKTGTAGAAVGRGRFGIGMREKEQVA